MPVKVAVRDSLRFVGGVTELASLKAAAPVALSFRYGSIPSPGQSLFTSRERSIWSVMNSASITICLPLYMAGFFETSQRVTFSGEWGCAEDCASPETEAANATNKNSHAICAVDLANIIVRTSGAKARFFFCSSGTETLG